MAVITKGIELCILGFEIIVEISLCFMTAILISMHFIETTLASMTKERGKPSKKRGQCVTLVQKKNSHNANDFERTKYREKYTERKLQTTPELQTMSVSNYYDRFSCHLTECHFLA